MVSTDATGEIVSTLRKSDGRIRLERSPGAGQVQALNHGFKFAEGRYIKTIDCDDLVLPDFSRCLDRVTSADATLHQALLLDANGRDLKRFIVPDTMVRMTLRRSLARIRVSPPRWSWTLSMDLARRVFPLPPDLPAVHEDVFYGLKIKKHAATMAYVPEPLYLYRQHAGQLFGGQYDYSRENVIRKARAMLAVMETVEASDIVEGIRDLPAPAGGVAHLLRTHVQAPSCSRRRPHRPIGGRGKGPDHYDVERARPVLVPVQVPFHETFEGKKMIDKMNRTARPKVLISAFACHPEPRTIHFPGEAILGWSLIKEIEKSADCHVMTWAMNREGIENSPGYGRPGGTVFHFLDLPDRYWRTLGDKHYGLRFYYFLWQRLAGSFARRLHKAEHFDLCHQITFSNEWMPSFMGPALSIPFIWGTGRRGGRKSPGS